MMYPTSNLDELHDDALIARCVGIEKERNRIFDGRRSEYSAEALCSELGMYSRLLEARGMSFSEQRAKINRQL